MAIFGDTLSITVDTVAYTFKYLGPVQGASGSIYLQTGVDAKVALRLETGIEKSSKRQRSVIKLSGDELVDDAYYKTNVNHSSASAPQATKAHINKLKSISRAISDLAAADDLADGFY